jgi:hypothetical protein
MSIREIAAWRQMQNWFNSQAAITQQDTSANDGANSALTTAQSNYYQNSATLTAQAVLKREQTEAHSQTAALHTLVNEANSAGGTSSSGSSSSSVNLLA